MLRTRPSALFSIPRIRSFSAVSELRQPAPDSTLLGRFLSKHLAGEKSTFTFLFPQEMGLPMNNLHAPTVPSGPTSGPQGDRSALDRLSLMELISRKDNLEAELKALGSVLDSVSVIASAGLMSRNGH
jgi:hypothetical protein